MYGQYQYSTLSFGDSATHVLNIEYSIDLIKHLPPFWHTIREMRELQGSIGTDIGALQHDLDDLLKQFVITTSTWGLAYWEKELGLSADPTLSYNRRREIILAKLWGAGTTTKAMIKTVAAAFSGGDVDVIEYPSENLFEVKFIGIKGIPPNMAGLIKAIEEIKPAHLAYRFSYTYAVWDMLDGMIWTDLLLIGTWDELKAYG